MPITSSDDVLTFLDEMTTRRFFKTHLPKDLMPLQVWDKKPKVNALNIHVIGEIWHKLIVLHINANIKLEVAEEGDRLTLYLFQWSLFCLA
jgi:hypothetical protein